MHLFVLEVTTVLSISELSREETRQTHPGKEGSRKAIVGVVVMSSEA